MASLDPAVASILDRATREGDSDDDALFEELENDSSRHLDALRERRLQQLKVELARAKDLRAAGAGTYIEIKDEKSLIDISTSTKLCIVHFFKPDFNRCRIMDGHLETLAHSHLDARFSRINVESAPFLVTKLKIQVLPCVLGFVNGISKDRILGFEGLGRGNDAFTTRDLEARLIQAGVLSRSKLVGDGGTSVHHRKQDRRDEDDEEHDEWE